VARGAPGGKVYIDGDLAAEATAPYQDLSDRAEVTLSCLGHEVSCRRPRNPHSGSFFLSAEQMSEWSRRPNFLDRAADFFSPLESAATLGIMQTFRLYKPARQAAAFLEIEHVGDSWIRKLAGWGRRAKEQPKEHKTAAAATADSNAQPDRGDAKKTVLHVGCGRKPLDRAFPKAEWREIRLDINAAVGPDVVATITDLRPIPSASVDAVWSSHNIEHLFAHEVSRALEEFLRVLRPSGFVLITLPDVQEVARHVAEGNLERPLYESRAGPISAIDVLFGDRKSIARGEVAMAHKTGFTAASLRRRLEEAGFRDVGVRADRERLALWAKGHKP
jgi:hypothetical protein